MLILIKPPRNMASCKVVAWRAKDWLRRIRGVMRERQRNKLESLARTLLEVETVERSQFAALMA